MGGGAKLGGRSNGTEGMGEAPGGDAATRGGGAAGGAGEAVGDVADGRAGRCGAGFGAGTEP